MSQAANIRSENESRAFQSLWDGILRIGRWIFYLFVLGIVALVSWVGPCQSGIVAQGTDPQGRPYCIVQTFKHIIDEPYQVSFYLKDEDGNWRWNYLEHEDVSWRSASAAFSDKDVTIMRNGKAVRTIPLPPEPLDTIAGWNAQEDYALPGDLSADEVAEAHHAIFEQH